MSDLPYLFLAMVAGIGALGVLIVWARRSWLVKAQGIAAVLVLLGVSYLALADLIGRPKPIALEWLADGREVDVLAAVPIEGVAIYVYILTEGFDEPLSIVIPWSQQAAQQLQDAQEKAEGEKGEGGEGRVKMRFEYSLDPQEPMFYPMPQQALPPKPAPEGKTFKFQGEEHDA